MPEVRLITPITRQSTKKMQVAAYCRVSSNSADQLNSYAAQIRAYKKYIGARDDWELVDIFADEGLTGMKSETRDEFQRMIRMCELKQIQVCKSFFSKVLKLLAFQGVWMFLYSRFPLFFPLSGKNKGKSYCTLSSSFAASRLASLLACA